MKSDHELNAHEPVILRRLIDPSGGGKERKKEKKVTNCLFKLLILKTLLATRRQRIACGVFIIIKYITRKENSKIMW